MIEQPGRLPVVVAGAALVGIVLDLFALLLLPTRLGGHLVPLAPALVLVGSAVISTAANRLAADRLPAQVLIGIAIVLSCAGVVRGPGGDLIVTRDLEGMFLAFVIAACFGAAVPLLRRTRAAPPP